MAGKSTFLKATGISVFLSQIGFPVPAAYMETSVFDGLITTINLADNIQHGNSHFYTEVSRVKHVANKMTESQNMLVIFDELFRGTNVKDAFDASLAIVSAFSKLRNSFFIISTHIVEVANELAAIENISFKFMETTFDNEMPQYSYKLQNGITEERLGMWIVKNEGIVEIIERIIAQESREPIIKT
jgi:DNA mismatch repair protein MutS